MSPSQIAGFVLALLVQSAAIAYFIGRLTKDVETNKEEVAKKASKEQVEAITGAVNKLSEVFQDFLKDVDQKLDRVRDSDERDDARLVQAVVHLEEYVGTVANWIGERLGAVSAHLNDHERLIRKALKANNLSDDRIQAVNDTGRHPAVSPPPRPTGSGSLKVSIGRKDPRAE